MDTDSESKDSSKDRSLNRLMWIVNQLFSMSKNSTTYTNESLLEQILSYLLVNSYFETDNDKSDLHKSLIRHEKNEKLENHIRDTLLRYVAVLVGKKDCTNNQAIITLIENVQEFIESKSKSNLKLNAALSEKKSEYKALCGNTVKILGQLNQQLKVRQIIWYMLFKFVKKKINRIFSN